MKRLSTILALLLLSIAVLAQVPQQFTYQALICDAENEIVSNRVITVQLSIVTANDSVVYSETHQTTTNENGVVSLAVGTGTTNDNFSQIDWSKGEYYLQTVADLGADEQLVSGISPLLSVPYAFYAEKAGNTTELNLTNYVKKTDLNSYAKPSALPTKISDLLNDANYVTLNDVPQPDMSNYYSKAEFDALLAGIRAEYSSQQGGTVNIENGAIKAGFSVAEGKQVYFSQGNLQFNAMQGTHACADGTTQQGTWRFAEHQWDIIGEDNTNTSSSYNGWIDLFCWGTSGWNSGANEYQPYSTSTEEKDFYINGNPANSITGNYANADWGVYNAISNGGNKSGMWRILTYDEWYYILFSRANALSRRGVATIDGVNGVILLPDDWTLPNGISFTNGVPDGSFWWEYQEIANKNNYSKSEWSRMEANGAVFLPITGYRYGTEVYQVDSAFDYWSSSIDSRIACTLGYDSDDMENLESRYIGLPVRLVQDADGLPKISISDVKVSMITTAVISCNVTNDGGATVTERGVCWATTENPTISDNKQTSGSGTGIFSVSLTNLIEGTIYYVRAYATNSNGTVYSNEISFKASDGVIKAGFSVSDDKQVYFSQGNLQYQASTNTWRFAQHQYDIIGKDNKNVSSSSYSGWIDLFGWGTSGYNGITPYGTAWADCSKPIAGTNYDWGIYNKIFNAGDSAGLWRTLDAGEWVYIIFNRSNATSLRGMATINGINGLILLPDNWTLPEGLTFTIGENGSYSYAQNIYSIADWAKMEVNGAVFLPAAGGCDVQRNVGDVGSRGYYWSSTPAGNYDIYAVYLYFYSNVVNTNFDDLSYFGISVRLVQDVESTSSTVLPTITTGEATKVAISSAIVNGNVTSNGGASVTERGVCWATTENPTISDNKLTNGSGTGEFTVSLTNLSAGTTYYARAYAINTAGIAYGNEVTFTTESEGGNVIIENGAIKAGFSISPNSQIYFSQGNLQYQASTNTWRFAENQWDYVGDATNGTVYENGVKCNNAKVSESYTGWIDLFGWGTSGWNSGANAYQPYATSENQEDYVPGNSCINDLTGNYANADWGVYNSISNGGNQTGQWRTLSYQEWCYLTLNRNDASDKCGVATVNNIIGLIVLPDDWTLPDGITFYGNYHKEGFSLNNYTLEDWEKMEANGAVFLPAAGYRYGINVGSFSFSKYWFSSTQGCGSIDYLNIGSSYGWGTNDGEWASSACAVRLVQDMKTTSSMVLPTIITGEATEVAISSATVSGTVTSDSGASVTERGVCWATTENPTISDNKIASGNGTGEFSVSLTNLSEGTTYYARAYATYSEGTVYGNKVIFTTKSNNSVSNTIVENGAIKAGFSVSDTNQVYFSQGNLQYQASTGTWRFAERQYYMLGDDNANISSSYNGWIDLFGWGTSGWNSGANEYQPYSTSTSWGNYCPGGSYVVDLTGDYARADWGVYNAISNGGNKAGLWRTLTYSEWTYLLNTRTDASSKKGIATVNGVNGLILLPDNWTLPDGLSFRSEVANDFGEEYYATVNNYTASDWDKMEANGALFLPAAGIRSGNFVSGTELWGHYWSTSSLDGDSYSYCLIFMSKNFENGIGVLRYNGLSVRLVQDVESTSSAVLPTITTGEATEVAMSSATINGNVTSDGGASVTERGICWATTENPTISDNKNFSSSNGTGEFTILLTNLSAGTTYYARAYAINTAGIAYGNEVTFTTESEGGNVTIENGAIKAAFSVAEGKQVYFSQGNLQFNAMQGTHACADGTTQQGTWRFAENQWDMIGADNKNISETYDGWIDLFGWGTSGWNSGVNAYQPYSTSTSYEDYDIKVYSNDLIDSYANADWGVYNAISNGGNQAGHWQTLTFNEWDYLVFTRANASSRKGIATVNNVTGLILLPDNWKLPSGLTFTSGANGGYGQNIYSIADWAKMEANGAVFLPSAGYRDGTDVYDVGSDGDYWSSSADSYGYADYLDFGSDYVGASNGYRSRYLGLSVRLVQDVESTSSAVLPTITTGEATEVAISSAFVNGNVTSDGGASVTERGVCWATTENPTISDNKNFSSSNGIGEFTILLTNLSAGTTYYARAYATNSEGTAYGNVVTFTTEDEGGNVTIENGAIKAGFSVAEGKQVYFSQGNLQFNAMQGTHACADGTTKQGTWRFAEHQYDMIGEDNTNISSSYNGWIDLFGWGTSGYNNYSLPYRAVTLSNGYCKEVDDISETNYDWGRYNAVSNGRNLFGLWRTLTYSEWDYIIDKRTDASSKNGLANVNGVNGLILLPDNWILPDGLTFISGENGDFMQNIYSIVDWEKMETNGAVFLPAAGRRIGADVIEVGTAGIYCSSRGTGSPSYNEECLNFSHNSANMTLYGRHFGLSVRLVQDAE